MTKIENYEQEDDPWDVFLSDDDLEPEPELGDFWVDDHELRFTDLAIDGADDFLRAAV